MNRGLDWLWMRRGSVTVWYEYDGAGVWLVSRSLDRSPGDCLSLCVWPSWASTGGAGCGWVSKVEQAGGLDWSFLERMDGGCICYYLCVLCVMQSGQ